MLPLFIRCATPRRELRDASVAYAAVILLAMPCFAARVLCRFAARRACYGVDDGERSAR